MAGTIAADTLTHSTAGSIATNYVVEGSVKSWAILNGTGTISLDDSLNVASVADSGTGDYDFTHSSAFSSSNYCTTTAKNNTSSNQGANLTLTNRSTTVRGVKSYENNSATDCSQVCFQTSGDLA
jgi:hypothetical protein